MPATNNLVSQTLVHYDTYKCNRFLTRSNHISKFETLIKKRHYADGTKTA
ncbi:hypothetical protein Lpl7_0104 [Lacticaseibacillus paracasei subsp. tolerans Lpl7]|nr:hypothetical protein Lpl7_0104 [Lacticaseibacillus paracasei subsp. tolerans Lpl7]